MLKEYRVSMPMSLEEYKVVQFYIAAKTSNFNPLLGERFSNKKYRKETMNLAGLVPDWFKPYMKTSDSLEYQAESWSAFPYRKVVLTHKGYDTDNFYIEVETSLLKGWGERENVFNLNNKMLDRRAIYWFDLERDWKGSVSNVMTAYILVTAHVKGFGEVSNRQICEGIHNWIKDEIVTTHKMMVTQVDMWQGTLTMRDIMALEMEDSSDDEEY